jgi:hypothetical protein
MVGIVFLIVVGSPTNCASHPLGAPQPDEPPGPQSPRTRPHRHGISRGRSKGNRASSMSQLKRFPVDALRIDQTFVAGLGIDAGDHAIVDATVRLAASLVWN